MEYRTPTLEDEKLLKEYVNEHFLNNEVSISASFGLSKLPYHEWYNYIHDAEINGAQFGKANLYLCFENDKLIGLLSVRYEPSKEFEEKYGHIGYGVRPSERRKNYATRMLKFGIEICKEKGLKEVVVGCYSYNIASKKTIEKNNGVLYREVEDNGKTCLFYKIQVSE